MKKKNTNVDTIVEYDLKNKQTKNWLGGKPIIYIAKISRLLC